MANVRDAHEGGEDPLHQEDIRAKSSVYSQGLERVGEEEGKEEESGRRTLVQEGPRTRLRSVAQLVSRNRKAQEVLQHDPSEEGRENIENSLRRVAQEDNRQQEAPEAGLPDRNRVLRALQAAARKQREERVQFAPGHINGVEEDGAREDQGQNIEDELNLPQDALGGFAGVEDISGVAEAQLLRCGFEGVQGRGRNQEFEKDLRRVGAMELQDFESQAQVDGQEAS
mmetsp:Transcript_15363/g.28698  ORF Transcript_15363/g.28698 Transcript_15363/m.28698 type:complete len:227 (+) Transcript_15363:2226-2906(+)